MTGTRKEDHMNETVIYGASDDLIEVDGDGVSDEFTASRFGPDASKEGGILAFSDGTVLEVVYGDDGIWRVHRLASGSAQFAKSEALGDEGEREDGRPAYSDVVTLTGDLTWVVYGESITRKPVLRGDA